MAETLAQHKAVSPSHLQSLECGFAASSFQLLLSLPPLTRWHQGRGKRKRRFRSKLGVTVAGSDLRRLNHDESRKVLDAFGVENIPSNGWTRIEMITALSTRLAGSAQELAEADPELARFARAAAAAAARQRETPFDNPQYAK